MQHSTLLVTMEHRCFNAHTLPLYKGLIAKSNGGELYL